MDEPVSNIKTNDLAEISIYLPVRALRVLESVAQRRFLKRAVLIRQIILQEIQDNPEYSQDTDP